MTVKHKHNHHHRNHFNISNDVEKIKAALYDTTQDLKGRAGEVLSNSMNSVKDQTAHLRDNTADYVAKQPFKAIGIALLTGMVIGWWVRRK